MYPILLWLCLVFGAWGNLPRDISSLNNTAISAQTTTITQYYDPQVEFLEIGVSVNGKTTWKLYGPDGDGGYGSQQGLGGLESLIGTSSTGVIQDQFGNVIGSIVNLSVLWSSNRLSLYGPVEGYSGVTLSSSALTTEHLGWRGKWRDVTGLYYWGARPYDFERRSFLTFDPLGHAATPDGYSAFNGNPAVYWDADGRFGKGALNWSTGIDLNSGLSFGQQFSSWNDGFVEGRLGAARTRFLNIMSY